MTKAPKEGGAPVRREFLVFGRPFVTEDDIREVVDTLRSGWIGFGPKTLRFEADFASYAHASHAVAVNSCTAALHLALIAAGVGPGDEVITTPLTFAATANVITHVGAKPVFVDVDRATQNICPDLVESALTPRTKAILPVHMAGWPCDLESISRIADGSGIPVIEDAAHAIEAWYKGRKIGAISAMTAFSFYATKNLTTAEGGMLTTEDGALANRLRTLRLHGLDKDAWKRYSHGGFLPYETVEPGYKYNMTDLQASMGLHQLARIESSLAKRQRLWRLLDQGLGGLEEVRIPTVPEEEGSRHARHLYTIHLELERLEIDRDEFIRALAAENIGAGVHFVPIHLHAYYRGAYGYRRGDYPSAEWIGDRTVSLPLSAGMSEEDAADVVAAVHKVVTRHSRKLSFQAAGGAAL